MIAKDKEYYITIFDEKWNRCLKLAEEDIQKNGGAADIVPDIATEIFEECANAEDVVGYYITYHGDDALRDWLDNTKGIAFSEQDKEVDCILKKLYPTPKEIHSQTLEQTIKIPKKEMERINKLLSMTGDEIYQKFGIKRGQAVVHTAKFPDNIEVDIKLVICDGDETPFTEAILFQNGCECALTPVEFEYGGEWELEYDGNEYIVNVITED